MFGFSDLRRASNQSATRYLFDAITAPREIYTREAEPCPPLLLLFRQAAPLPKNLQLLKNPFSRVPVQGD